VHRLLGVFQPLLGANNNSIIVINILFSKRKSLEFFAKGLFLPGRIQKHSKKKAIVMKLSEESWREMQ